MKKLILAAVILLVTTAHTFAISITVTLTTKAHWDGSSCAYAPQGICVRLTLGTEMLSTNEVNGNMSYDKARGIILTFSKSKDLQKKGNSSLFANNSFIVDGDSPISYSLLRKIGYSISKDYTIKKGKYSYSTEGDIITVIIPVN